MAKRQPMENLQFYTNQRAKKEIYIMYTNIKIYLN